MIYAISDELLLVVFGLIESDYSSHVEVLEDLEIIFGSVSSSFEFTNIVERSHERNKLIRYNPVQIPIFYFFVVFIFFVVKFSKLVPTQSDSVLEPLQAMED